MAIQEFLEALAHGIVFAIATCLPSRKAFRQDTDQGELIACTEVIADDGEDVTCEFFAIRVGVLRPLVSEA